MNVKKYFDYSPDLELTVAQIGINKWDWIAINENDLPKAQSKMQAHRFDILPLHQSNTVDRYFTTLNWGDFSKIELRNINQEDKIYYRLSFLDLIRKMLRDKNNVYFLTDSNEVLGLISLNNLNCLAVYNYLYQITASLERLVTQYLESILSEELVLDILKKTSDKQANIVAAKYLDAQTKNTDNSIFHHIYFPNICTILKKASDHIPENKKSLVAYGKNFNSDQLYGKIRNNVSHPVRPLFSDFNSVKEVNQLIEDYIDIKKLLKD